MSEVVVQVNGNKPASLKGDSPTKYFPPSPALAPSLNESRKELLSPNMTIDNYTPTPANGNGKFGFTKQELAALVSPHKDHSRLAQYGYAPGIMAGLGVDENQGLSTASGNVVIDRDIRLSAFGANRLPTVKPKTLIYYMLKAMSDKIMILLSIVSCISLSIGIYEDVHTEIPSERIHWIEGFSVMTAVIIVVLASSINDLQKDKQFRTLNAKKEDRVVKGVRNGQTQMISIYEILVGDILLLEPGDVIAADGIFISGMGLKCDESSATGETDAIRKGTGHDCFIVSGSKVTEGIGRYVVTGVGESSFFGNIMMALRVENDDTPLQVKLDGLAERIAKLGTSFAVLLLVLLFLKYVIVTMNQGGFGNGANQETGSEAAQQLVKILLVSIAIVAVAVPEGLPLAVTLALAYATTRMMKDNNLVRVLSACETMGNATTICSDKTGTLTQNRMTVVTGVFGKNAMFEGDQEISELKSKIAPIAPGSADNSARKEVGPNGNELLDTIMEGVALNSSAFEGVDDSTGKTELVGSKTEVALLEWAVKSGFDYKKIRAGEKSTVVQVYPFSSERKSMSTLVKVTRENGPPVYRMHVKGAPEIVMRSCDRVVLVPFSPSATAIKFEASRASDEASARNRRPLSEVPATGSRSNPEGSIIYPLDDKIKSEYTSIIEGFALQSLRTICLAYREFSVEEFNALVNGPLREKVVAARKAEREAEKNAANADDEDILRAPEPAFLQATTPEEDVITEADVLGHALALNEFGGHGLIVGSIVGIEDPLRVGVPEAVKACQDAGVFVRMVTGDNIMTAKSIATKCGIYSKGGLVMEGEYFRKLTDEQMAEMIPRLQVLARSSPMDKQILVSKLKEYGETVAVTGDGTNDGPALKMADIGFSMGIAGTEVAKEASSIILMDDSFSSVVKAILWGRSVNDAVKKFLQFQLSVNISAVMITLISALVDAEESAAITVVQLLWINLIMDTLAALALATEVPTNELLQRPPEGKKAALITFPMWKMIVGQAFLQVTVNMILLFAGPKFFGFDELAAAGGVNGEVGSAIVTEQRLILKTIIFNSFVFLQIFNMVNARRIDSNINVFRGILSNPPFFIILGIIILSQCIIIEFGDIVFKTHHLNAGQWLACLLCGSLTLPWGMMLRLLPDEIFNAIGIKTEPETAHQYILDQTHQIEMEKIGGRKTFKEKVNKKMQRLRLTNYNWLRGGKRRRDDDDEAGGANVHPSQAAITSRAR
ncbi:PMCA-type calcium-translocating P-type ATPase [Obelidium mucronatum]|nr:PMCA-type calcium-translocating P-type ATPase [Obelidium mucronatum]